MLPRHARSLFASSPEVCLDLPGPPSRVAVGLRTRTAVWWYVIPVSPSLTYREYPPPLDLAPWIACFWRIAGGEASATPVPHRVLPDGCADLLFDLRSSHGQAELVGPMSSAQLFGLGGRVDLLGARLRPGVVRAFTGIPADQLLDTVVPMREVPTLRVDIAELSAVAETAGRIRLVSDACRERLAALEQPDRVIRYALTQWLRAERSRFPTISVLTRDVGLSERAFERRFVAHVGLTPVRYRRLARFRSVLRLHASGVCDWAELAAITGFSDQPHLVRDCRAFTGLTPTEWAVTQQAGAGFLQDGNITTT
jgi:AraC-like DNA-binding protein